MGQAISDILPLAIGVMISPMPIIAVILMLFSARARSNGPAFLAGWVVGLTVLFAVVYALADNLDVGTDSGASDSTSTVKMVLGVVLIVMAFRHWRSRPGPGETAPMPKWMTTIDAITPVRAIGLGVLLSAVNPKNLILTAGTAAGVAQADVSTSDAVVALIVFVVIASVSIAIPVGVYLLSRDHAQHILDGWKVWLEHNNATVMTVLLLVIGVVLFSKGLGPITA